MLNPKHTSELVANVLSQMQVQGGRGDSWTGVIEMSGGCWDVKYDMAQYDVHLKIMRVRDYVKCFSVNHAIEVTGNIYES